MLFDTDIFIWLQRGSAHAAQLVNANHERHISVYSYMEFLQGSQDSRQMTLNQSFLRDMEFSILPLTQNIGHRASIYIEQYALGKGLRAGDAIIAATAMEYGLTLATANAKHYRFIDQLTIKLLKP